MRNRAPRTRKPVSAGPAPVGGPDGRRCRVGAGADGQPPIPSVRAFGPVASARGEGLGTAGRRRRPRSFPRRRRALRTANRPPAQGRPDSVGSRAGGNPLSELNGPDRGVDQSSPSDRAGRPLSGAPARQLEGSGRTSAHPARRRGWRQGVLLPSQPRPPAETEDQGGDPREGEPGGQPEEEGREGRASPGLAHGGTAALESARSAKTELLAFGFDQLLHEFLRVHRVLGVMEDVIVLGA